MYKDAFYMANTIGIISYMHKLDPTYNGITPPNDKVLVNHPPWPRPPSMSYIIVTCHFG